MVSVVQTNTQPIGMFAGGKLLSGGAADPTITSNFSQTRTNDFANYPDGMPGTFTTTPGSVLSAGISAVAIVASIFKTKVGGASAAGEYTFVSYKNGNSITWKITSPSTVDNVDLSQYGISISGTPTVPGSGDGDGEGFVIEYHQGSESDDYYVILKEIKRIIVTQNVANKFLVGDMNLIGYLGTLEQYRRQMGGIRTYDPAFASVIGGYPKGAQLEYLQVYDGSTLLTRSDIDDPSFRYTDNYTYKMRKVLSLIDDNTYDFVATPSHIDNQKWMYCDVLSIYNPSMPSSVMTPQILCWVYCFARGSSSKRTFTATLNQDSYISYFVEHGTQLLVAGKGIRVYAILNGRTKEMTYSNARSIARKGTTVRVEVDLEFYGTDNYVNTVYFSVFIVAVPAIMNNAIQRL